MINQLAKLKNQVKNWHTQNLNNLSREEYFELQQARKDLGILYWFWRDAGTILSNKVYRSKFYKHSVNIDEEKKN